ncbi:MAG: 4-hydroxythreonine-4-phosphate dehydrogenase PdxA [Pseudomonadota bacterium]
MTDPPPLAVTMGDPAGIGPEITAGAWQSRADLPVFFALADPAVIAAVAPDLPVRIIAGPEEAEGAFQTALPVLPLALPAPVTPGQPNAGNAHATVSSIDQAVALCRSGAASGVVTNPIAKKVLYDGADFAYPGHTEYLAHLGAVPRTVMMLAAPGLRVVPVTIHIALSQVPSALTTDLIVETAQITAKALARDFAIAAPRLALAGLNPHAGEGGAMGREEAEIIVPAIEILRAEGLCVAGPLPADTMFHAAARARYDAALTMYHDQGLVPVKMLDFANGVNVTLGLPFVRTSPDHGTAFDIAGLGTADPSSLIAAIRMAGEIARARANAP